MARGQQTCRHCIHFVDDPARIEAEFPNLTILGSAYSSARGEAGICHKLGTFQDPLDARQCPWFAPRPETPPTRSRTG